MSVNDDSDPIISYYIEPVATDYDFYNLDDLVWRIIWRNDENKIAKSEIYHGEKKAAELYADEKMCKLYEKYYTWTAYKNEDWKQYD